MRCAARRRTRPATLAERHRTQREANLTHQRGDLTRIRVSGLDVVRVGEVGPGRRACVPVRERTSSDPNSRIPTTSGIVLTEGRAINDAGRIVANGTNAHGRQRALVLIPR
jgi:hypothetical protein